MRASALWAILGGTLLATSGVGCGSHQPLDPRKYFSRTDPLETVVSFSWSVAARKWEHVSDCLRIEDGAGVVSKEDLKGLADLEVHTRREEAGVDVSAGEGEAELTVEVTVPFEEGYEAPNGRSEFRALLVPREVVEGVRLWVIDARRTLEANSPVPKD